MRQFSKALRKLELFFALNTEYQYWTVRVQYLCRVKKNSMTSNVLPLHFSPSQASSSQNSKFDSHLLYCEVDSLKRSKSESPLLALSNKQGRWEIFGSMHFRFGFHVCSFPFEKPYSLILIFMYLIGNLITAYSRAGYSIFKVLRI